VKEKCIRRSYLVSIRKVSKITHVLSSLQSLLPCSIYILRSADGRVSIKLLVVERKSESTCLVVIIKL